MHGISILWGELLFLSFHHHPIIPVINLIVRLPRFLRFVVLYRVVDVAQDPGHAVLVLHVQLQERHHAEIINQARDGPVELPEAPAAHDGLRVRRVRASSQVLIGVVVVVIVFHQRSVRVEEPFELPFRHRSLDQIHLRQDVDVWDLEHDHGAHCGEGAGEEFGAVDDEGGFEEVGGAEGDVEGAEAGQVVDEAGHDGDVGVELDLAGEVDDDEIFFRERFQGLGEEVEVLEKEPGGGEGGFSG